jgi:uncharacterized protein YgiM (DUF1202 family)
MKQPKDRNRVRARAVCSLLVAALLLAFASLACSVGQALVGRSTGVVSTPTKTPRPTFTPLPTLGSGASTVMPGVRGVLPPGVTVQPPNTGGSSAPIAASPAISGTQGSLTDGAINVVLYATETPPPSPTPEPAGPTPEPTRDVETNRPLRGGGPRPVPTPYAIVKSATINGRRGPGATFARIGQAKKGDELMIIGRTPDGAWWQVCCLANQAVWVSADLVEAKGPVDTTPLLTPAPTPVPPRPAAPRPTATPAPTPMPPFDIARGPEFPIQRDGGIMTMLVQVYEGPPDSVHPLGGFQLRVFRDGVDVTQNAVSFDDRAFDATLAVEGGFKYNLKFEMPNAGEADWKIYLAGPGGFRMSPVSEFTTKGDSYRNQVIYIAYKLAR